MSDIVHRLSEDGSPLAIEAAHEIARLSRGWQAENERCLQLAHENTTLKAQAAMLMRKNNQWIARGKDRRGVHFSMPLERRRGFDRRQRLAI